MLALGRLDDAHVSVDRDHALGSLVNVTVDRVVVRVRVAHRFADAVVLVFAWRADHSHHRALVVAAGAARRHHIHWEELVDQLLRVRQVAFRHLGRVHGLASRMQLLNCFDCNFSVLVLRTFGWQFIFHLV